MRSAALGLLFAVAIVVPGSAQINITVTLPFPFQAENTKFNAGTFTIKQASADSSVTIRSQQGNQSGVFSQANLPTESPFERNKTWLVFHRYGEEYFLAEIWTRRKGHQMMLSAAEKQLRESGTKAVEVKVNVSMK